MGRGDLDLYSCQSLFQKSSLNSFYGDGAGDVKQIFGLFWLQSRKVVF